MGYDDFFFHVILRPSAKVKEQQQAPEGYCSNAYVEKTLMLSDHFFRNLALYSKKT
jgi:hypothetical protein